METTDRRSGISPNLSIRRNWGNWQTGIGFADQRPTSDLDDSSLIVGDGPYMFIDDVLTLDYTYNEELEIAAKEFEGLTRYRRNALTFFGAYSFASPSGKWSILPKAGMTMGFLQSDRRVYIRKVVTVSDPNFPDLAYDQQRYDTRQSQGTALQMDAHISEEVRRKWGTRFLVIAESGLNVPLSKSISTGSVKIQPWYARIGFGYCFN